MGAGAAAPGGCGPDRARPPAPLALERRRTISYRRRFHQEVPSFSPLAEGRLHVKIGSFSLLEMGWPGRPADAANSQPVPLPQGAGSDVLTRALVRARWTIFWERLWPALASVATVIGLFLAVSWLGLWLWMPPIARAIGLGIFFLLTAAAFAPLLMLRVPSRAEGLRRLDRNSGLPHRPATAIADEIAAPSEDSYSIVLWRAHIERALRAAKTLRAGIPVPRLALRDPLALRALVAGVGGAAFFSPRGEEVKRLAPAFAWAGGVAPPPFPLAALGGAPPPPGRAPGVFPGPG